MLDPQLHRSSTRLLNNNVRARPWQSEEACIDGMLVERSRTEQTSTL
jgi:hypothetical protein